MIRGTIITNRIIPILELKKNVFTTRYNIFILNDIPNIVYS